MKHKPFNKQAMGRSFLSGVARVVGVAMSAAFGSMLYKYMGSKSSAAHVMILLGVVSFVILWFVEYEREIL